VKQKNKKTRRKAPQKKPIKTGMMKRESLLLLVTTLEIELAAFSNLD